MDRRHEAKKDVPGLKSSEMGSVSGRKGLRKLKFPFYFVLLLFSVKQGQDLCRLVLHYQHLACRLSKAFLTTWFSRQNWTLFN